MLRRWNPIQRYCPVIVNYDVEVWGKRKPCGNKLRPDHKYCGHHKTRYSRRFGTIPPPKDWMRKVRSNRCQKRGCWTIVQSRGSYPYLPKNGQFCHRHLPQCIVLGCPNKPTWKFTDHQSGKTYISRDRSLCEYHSIRHYIKGQELPKRRCRHCFSTHHGWGYNYGICIRLLQKHTGLSLKEISRESRIPLKHLPTDENYNNGGESGHPLLTEGEDYRKAYLAYVWEKMSMYGLLDFYNLI